MNLGPSDPDLEHDSATLDAADLPDGELLAFLAGGLAHAFASPLQVIKIQSSLLTNPTDVPRAREVLQKACGAAESLLDVLRCVAGSDARTKPMQLGLFLPRVVEVLRFALRRRGLRIEALHTSVQTPVAVAQGALTLTLAKLVFALARGVPAWWQGSLYVDLHDQTPTRAVVLLGLESAPGALPFQLTIGAALREVCSAALALGISAEWNDATRVVTLHVPAVPAIGAIRG